MPVIRVSEEQKEWLDEKKVEYFNTEDVAYRLALEKVMENE